MWTVKVIGLTSVLQSSTKWYLQRAEVLGERRWLLFIVQSCQQNNCPDQHDGILFKKPERKKRDRANEGDYGWGLAIVPSCTRK